MIVSRFFLVVICRIDRSGKKHIFFLSVDEEENKVTLPKKNRIDGVIDTYLVRFLLLTTMYRTRLRCLEVTNALAYYTRMSKTKKRKF